MAQAARSRSLQLLRRRSTAIGSREIRSHHRGTEVPEWLGVWRHEHPRSSRSASRGPGPPHRCGTFVENLELPGAVFVVYVRSAMAHARIGGIDFERGRRRCPACWRFSSGADLDIGPTPLDLPCCPPRCPVRCSPPTRCATSASRSPQSWPHTRPRLSRRRRGGGGRLRPAAGGDRRLRRGRRDEVLLFPEAGTNAAGRIAGRDVSFEACDVVVRQRIVNQKIAPCPIEPRSAASRWEPDGRLTHWQASQGAHPVRERICALYGLEAGSGPGDHPRCRRRVRGQGVLVPRGLAPAVVVARRVGAPVRYVESRSESDARPRPRAGPGAGRRDSARPVMAGCSPID